jgi:hypothetical protein
VVHGRLLTCWYTRQLLLPHFTSSSTSMQAAALQAGQPTWYQEAMAMLRRTVTAAPMRLGRHHVLMVACTFSKTWLMKSRVGSTASASAAPSSPPLQHSATHQAVSAQNLVRVLEIHPHYYADNHGAGSCMGMSVSSTHMLSTPVCPIEAVDCRVMAIGKAVVLGSQRQLARTKPKYRVQGGQLQGAAVSYSGLAAMVGLMCPR